MFELYTNNGISNLIIKTAGNTCNINCTYCFEQMKKVSNGIITEAMLETLISKIEKRCSIVFHGGEPLLIGKKNFSKLLESIKKYYPEKVISVRIQTNGTLLDYEWVDILFRQFKELQIEIAISLDGTYDMNRLRVDYSGNNTYESVLNAFDILKKYNIKAGMLSVISRKSLKLYREYIELIESIDNLKFVKINGLFNMENNKLSEDSITPMEYAVFIEKITKFYIEKELYKKFAVEPILSILQKIKGKESSYCNYSERKCYNHISCYPDGKIGPCDCLSINEFSIDYEHDQFIEESIVSTLKNGHLLEKYMEQCEKCSINNFCNGGCISHRYYFRNNIELLQEYCDSKHRLYEYFNRIIMEGIM